MSMRMHHHMYHRTVSLYGTTISELTTMHISHPAELMNRAPAGEVDDDLYGKIFVSAAAGMTIAACTTLARVAIRFRRIGWDDGLALVGLFSLAVTAVVGSMFYKLDEQSTMPQGSRVALYYISTVTFNFTVWISRLSIMVNIIRLGSYQRRLRIAAGIFIIILLVLIAQIFWVCEPQNRRTNWKSKTAPQCVLGKSVAITQVTTDAFADLVLVVVPLLLLRYLQSAEAKAQKVRLAASFVVGGLTTVVSIVHAIYLLQNTRMSIIVTNVELSVSVIISNFAVLAAAIHRLWNKYHPPEKVPEHTTIEFQPAPPPTSTLSMSETDDLSSGALSERRDREDSDFVAVKTVSGSGDLAIVESGWDTSSSSRQRVGS